MELWHYTSIDVFTKIVESKTIRASHIADMNDKSELINGLKCVKKALSAEIKPHLKKELNSLLNEAKEGNKDIYTTSFSKADDSLYQWNSYTPKDHGIAIRFEIKTEEHLNATGFNSLSALDFFASSLNKSFIGCKFPPRFYPCVYTKKNKSEFFTRNSEDKYVEKYSFPTDKKDCFNPDSIFNNHNEIILVDEALRLKHHAFSFENEVRLVCHLNDLREEKKCAAKFTRYVDLHFNPKDTITGVRISPYGDIKKNKHFVQDYIKKSVELDNSLKVLKSEIPVR